MRKLFTLIELLVVIAIIAILASVLMPALNKARKQSYAAGCFSNEKQISYAIHSYANDYEDFLPHSGPANYVAESNWNALTANYLNINILDAYHLHKGIFNCPAQKDGNCGKTAMGYNGFYGGYGWNYTYLGWKEPSTTTYLAWVKRNQVKKPANTIVLGDTTDDKQVSGNEGVHFFLYYPLAFSGLTYYASRHNGGGNMLWIDCHTSFHKRIELIQNIKWYQRE